MGDRGGGGGGVGDRGGGGGGVGDRGGGGGGIAGVRRRLRTGAGRTGDC